MYKLSSRLGGPSLPLLLVLRFLTTLGAKPKMVTTREASEMSGPRRSRRPQPLSMEDNLYINTGHGNLNQYIKTALLCLCVCRGFGVLSHDLYGGVLLLVNCLLYVGKRNIFSPAFTCRGLYVYFFS